MDWVQTGSKTSLVMVPNGTTYLNSALTEKFGDRWPPDASMVLEYLRSKVKCKNESLTLSRLWTKAHKIPEHQREPFVVPNAVLQLSVSCFLPKIFAVKFRSRRKKSKSRSFLGFIFGERRPKFWIYIFKSGSLHNVWHNLVNFCSANSEGSSRNKKERKKIERNYRGKT